MKSRIVKAVILFLATLSLSSCVKDNMQDAYKEGDPVDVTLNFKAQENIIVSRAVSSAEDENRIYNVYIFVVDSNGEISHREFFGGYNAQVTQNLEIKNVISGKDKTIYALVNVINNSMMSTTKEVLDDETKIATRDDLNKLTSELTQEAIQRGTNFMMSGSVTVDLVPAMTNPVIIPVHRLDAKVRFKIKTGIYNENTQEASPVEFTADSWRVVNAIKKVRVFPSDELDVFAQEFPETYFSSDWSNFEGEGDEFGKTFAFYVLENKVSARNAIQSSTDSDKDFALREKQEKNEDGSNGAYLNAPGTGTYVQLKGKVRYKLNAEQEIAASVIYTIHLGYIESNKLDDYSVERNTEYIYTVTINGVDNIIMEAEKREEEEKKEPQPGAEGNVTMARVIKELDAHYEVFNIKFPKAQIDNSTTWDVSTPFSMGSEKDNPKDYKWVYFKLAPKSGMYYTSNIVAYPGNNKRYTGSIEDYVNDVNNATNSLLDVSQLVAVLKECKAKYSNENKFLFDTSDNINFVVFVNEFYYEENPLDGTTSKDLWKKFVNQPDRVLNVLSEAQTSLDGQSTKAVAVTSIRQASIQTIYNTESTEVFTAWGSQQKQDNAQYAFSARMGNNRAPAYDSESNGRQNTSHMWDVDANPKPTWDMYLNQTNVTSLTMKTGYNYIKYQCMRLNRDNDGDGNIGVNEVRWYLASLDQLRGLWIGEHSVNANTRLFQDTQWNERWYASSTVPDRSNQYDNPKVIWSAEGASDGSMSGAGGVTNGVYYYRCVRNLGIAPDEPVDTEPDSYIDELKISGRISTISLSRLNPKSIRGYTQTAELPEHHERQADNKPYWEFQVYGSASGGNLNWIQVRDRIDAGRSPCPDGWRTPNQREMVLMIAKLKNDGRWGRFYHMSRTRFQFNPSGGYRHGFSINATSGNADILFLINNDGERGGVRCVRDVKDVTP